MDGNSAQNRCIQTSFHAKNAINGAAYREKRDQHTLALDRSEKLHSDVK
jgi:hypothetical protein